MKFLKRVVLPLMLAILAVCILFPKVALVSFLNIVAFLDGVGKVVHTTDVADYGVITGNYDNETPKEFMFSFFPEEISGDFSNVIYQYTAQKGDTYACQIWLEFDIKDEEAYREFIDLHTNYEQTKVFRYDTNYLDYTISNHFRLTSPEDDEPGDIHIEYAEVGKILYCDDTQHIIFYALCMYDGGYSSTKTFGDFFTRFNISPVEYEAFATTPYLRGNAIEHCAHPISLI